MTRRPPRLGELETRLLEWLWGREWVDVREAHAALAAAGRRSPNTIHSTLERLIRKGLVERRRAGRAFAYRVIVSPRAYLDRALEQAIEEMPGGDPKRLLAAFVDVAVRLDEAALDELERLVAARRREQAGEALGSGDQDSGEESE
ncbi:MAG: BlaI/MecI/CopY family transcriptional regulator [Myxococcota bacterium]